MPTKHNDKENDHKKKKKSTTPLKSLIQREKTTLTTEPSIDSVAMITDDSPPMNSKPITMPKPYECWSTRNDSSTEVVSPKSPPPICSSSDYMSSTTCSPDSLNFFSRFPVEASLSSTPNERSSCTTWNGKKDSRTEADDYSLNAGPIGHLSLSNMGDNDSQGAGMNSEFQQAYKGQTTISQSTYGASNRGSPELDSPRHSLMTRPKPYSAFLDDVKKQEFEAYIDTWKRAKEEAIMDWLNRKEAAISEWEFRHASKATEEMKKMEKKLEKMRAKALEKLQKSLSMTKAEANKKALEARREAKEKMSKVSKLLIKARVSKNLSCLKL